MARFLNTTGPCNPERHYFLPPESRLRQSNLDRYIKDELFWVLHAPRQTDKTTFLMTWMRELNASHQAVACYISVERCQGVPEVERAIVAIRSAIQDYAKDFGLPIPEGPEGSDDPASLLGRTLKQWAELCAPLPLVVLFDEVDTLEGPALISFLRQLRGGFASRGIGKFPVSVALVGMGDLRDYLTQSKDSFPVNPGSPFNIKQDSATLSNFSRDDVVALLAQHSQESGQPFLPEAVMVGDPDVLLGRTDRAVELCMDLGLVDWSAQDGLHIANPLYREVLPRFLSQQFHDSITRPEYPWQRSDGSLDLDRLLKEFQKFWRRHSDIWESQADYTEAFPHLLLMAFLQRLFNGGGRIEREYAAGRGRMDLFIEFAGLGYIIEIKLVHPTDGRASTLEEALHQVARYRSIVGGPNTPTYIALFNRTPKGRALPWEQRLSWDVLDTPTGAVTVVGL